MNKDSAIDIITYPDMSHMEEGLLNSLCGLEREVWGYYGEYAVCSDINCRAIQNIPDAYDGVDDEERFVPLSELEKNGPNIPDCPECGGPSELIFPPKIMPTFLKHQFSGGVFGSLLVGQNREVQGCTIAKKGKLEELFDSMNYRQSYNKEQYLASVAKCLNFDHENGKDKEFVSWNRLEIAHALRGQRHFFPLLKALLDQHPEYDSLPVIGDTRPKSKVYPFLKVIGYRDVMTDEHGWVAVALESYGRLREVASLSRSEFQRIFQNNLREEREKREKYIIEKEPLRKKSKYKGLPTLKDILYSR